MKWNWEADSFKFHGRLFVPLQLVCFLQNGRSNGPRNIKLLNYCPRCISNCFLGHDKGGKVNNVNEIHYKFRLRDDIGQNRSELLNIIKLTDQTILRFQNIINIACKRQNYSYIFGTKGITLTKWYACDIFTHFMLNMDKSILPFCANQMCWFGHLFMAITTTCGTG